MPALATTMVTGPSVGDAVVERLLQRLDVADVGLVGDDAPPEGLDLADGLVQVLRRRHRVADGLDLLRRCRRR